MDNQYPTWKERWAQKLDTFFEKVAILNMDSEQKGEVALYIKESRGNDKLYWFQLVLSAIIGAFGLIQGSVAVVIGAMLIAPILGPIQGLAFGIVNGERKTFVQSLWSLFLTTLVCILIGYLCSSSVGFVIENTEILSRTKPTILDLMIALASGVIAFLSLRFKRLSSSIAGVAMASALLPPLLVSGIELALLDLSKAGQAFFLFFTNLIAILVVGIGMLFLFGYSSHVSHQLRTAKNAIIVLLIFAIMVVPLVGSFVSATEQARLQHDARTYLEYVLGEEFAKHSISRFAIDNLSSERLTIEADILIPEGVQVFAETQDAIESALRESLGTPVDLKLSVTRSISLISRSEITTSEVPTKEDEYRSTLTQVWRDIISGFGLSLEHVEVDFIGTESSTKFDPAEIERIDFFVRARGDLSSDEYEKFQDRIQNRARLTFPFESQIQLEISPVYAYSLNLSDAGNIE